MLKHRLLMSALLIPATIGLFVWDHHLGESAPVLLVLLLGVSARCVWELVVLARVAGFRPNLALCWSGVWAMLMAGWWHSDVFWNAPIARYFRNTTTPFGWFAVVAVALLMNAVIRYPIAKQPHETGDESQRSIGLELGTLGIEFFVIIYIGMLLVVTSRLRWADNDDVKGYFALGALVVATKMGDVGAYTFGRLIGGPKMVPKLSPGKTWAGGVGHLLTAGFSSVAWLMWIGPKICGQWHTWNFESALLFGVVVGFAGLMGDLAESLIKRDVGVKDAPPLLPGFGGLLDLMDSLLLAGPVAYWMWSEKFFLYQQLK